MPFYHVLQDFLLQNLFILQLYKNFYARHKKVIAIAMCENYNYLYLWYIFSFDNISNKVKAKQLAVVS